MTSVRMRWVWAALGVGALSMLGACEPEEWRELKGAPDQVVDVPAPGLYEGTMDVEVRAFGGPVRVAREDCIVRFTADVDPRENRWFVAEALGCDLGPKAGVVDFYFSLPTDTPYVGTMSGPLDGAEGRWNGWFHHETSLYIESMGEAYDQGGHAEFLVFINAVRVDAYDVEPEVTDPGLTEVEATGEATIDDGDDDED